MSHTFYVVSDSIEKSATLPIKSKFMSNAYALKPFFRQNTFFCIISMIFKIGGGNTIELRCKHVALSNYNFDLWTKSLRQIFHLNNIVSICENKTITTTTTTRELDTFQCS